MISRLLFTGMNFTDRHQGLMLAGVVASMLIGNYILKVVA